MILVTGASGLVGGHLIWQLLKKNENIVALKRKTTDIKPLKQTLSFYTSEPDAYLSKIKWKIGDVLDYDSILAAMDGISDVYHCAAIVSLNNSDQGMLKTNVEGTQNIINAALKHEVKRFCFVSSIATLGKTQGTKITDEKCMWDENENHSTYSQSKYLAEQEVWRAIKMGLPAVIVNPGVILGVSGTDRGSAKLFTQVRKGLPFYTHGGSGFVDVQDVANSMILLMEQKCFGERYIIVAENLSNKILLEYIAEGFRKSKPFIPIGKNLLSFIGMLAEITGKIFNFSPLMDRATARTASKRTYYSNQKIRNSIPSLQFIPIQKSVRDTCDFLLKLEKKQLL